MSSVYGRKVKEPKVTTRGPLSSSKAELQAKGLEQAWSHFGEAQTVLQRLEGRAGPTLEPPSYGQRPAKKRSVKFDARTTTTTTTSQRSGRGGGGRGALGVDDLENRPRSGGSEYSLEPTPLNNTSSHLTDTKGEGRGYGTPPGAVSSSGRPYTNTGGQPLASKRSAPVLSASHSLQFTPNPSSVSAGLYKPASYPLSMSSSASTFSRAGPGAVTSSFSSHSNMGAVFGQPVKFGSWEKSRPVIEGAEQPHPPSTSYFPLTTTAPSTYIPPSTYTAPSTSSAVSLKPSSATINVGSSSASSHTHHPRQLPVWTSPQEKQVPLRKFEVPLEGITSLRASVAEQRRHVEATGNMVKGMKRQQPLHEKPGFFALSEASTSRGNSTQATPTHAAQPAAPPTTTSYRYQPDELHAAKKRKVTSAPPPRVYAGFSSTDVSGSRPYRPTTQSHSYSTTSVRYGGTSTRSHSQDHGYSRVGSKPAGGVAGQSRVRKVHRFDSNSGRDAHLTGDLITPSSWRAGKELAERILREQQPQPQPPPSGQQQQRRDNQGPASISEQHSPSSASQLSSFCDSLDTASHHSSGTSQNSISDSTVLGDDIPPRPSAPSPARAVAAGTVVQSSSGLGEEEEVVGSEPDLFTSSVPEVQAFAPHLSADINQLLQELDSPAHELKPDSARRGGPERPLGGKVKGRGHSAEPASKKTKYSSEPAEKVRHYDQSEVQLYIQHKREERQRKAMEEQRSQEREARRRDEKLKHLYETQRRRVEANLRQKQKQREAISKAERQIHIHLHDASPVPRVTIQPPSIDRRPASTSTSPRHHHHLHSKTSGSHSGHTSPYYHPSPPTQPPPVSAHTSPPRYSSFRYSPHEGELGDKRGYSPRDDLGAGVNFDSSVVSPRTYSVPQSSASRSISPRGHAPQGQYGATPTSAQTRDYTRSSIRYDVPLTSTANAFRAGQSGAMPTSRFHTSYYSATPTATVPRSYYGTTPTSYYSATPTTKSYHSPTPTVPRSSYHTATPTTGHVISRPSSTGRLTGAATQLQSGEERLQAITAAAQDLKQRIMEQSRKLAGAGAIVGGLSEEVSPPATGGHRRSPYDSPLNRSLLVSTSEPELPGVRSLQQHAAQVERQRRETEAARRIQASFRGYQVRKSLRWQLPSGRTLGGVVQGARNVGDGVEEDESDDNTLTPKEEAGSGVATPTRAAGGRGARETTPPLPYSVPKEPWKQKGGDPHSIINAFARQHEAAWKIPGTHESRFSPGSYTPSPRLSPVHTQDVPRKTDLTPVDVTRKTESEEQSYSQVFESPSTTSIISALDLSPGGGATEVDGRGTPPLSVYSRDSLQDSRTPSTSVTPRSGSRPHSSDNTPTATPPRQQQGLSHQTTPTLSPSATPATTLPAVSIPKEDGISAITPPGSPSFVDDSFISAPSAGPAPPPVLPPSRGVRGGGGLAPREEGRMSPRSLELQMHAQLNILEKVEDSIKQVHEAESTRAVSQAQQEAARLTQLQQQQHERQLQTLQAKASESANRREEEARQAQVKMEAQLREQADQLSRVRQDSSTAVAGLASRLSEVAAATAKTAASQIQQHADVASNVAISAATVAAKEAVREVLKNVGARDETGEADMGESAISYKSDFDSTSSTIHTESLIHPPPGDHTPDHTHSLQDTSSTIHTESLLRPPLPDHTSSSQEAGPGVEPSVMSIPESLTPVPSDMEESGRDDEEESNEEVEEDVKEISHEIVVDEGHRLRQTSQLTSHLKPPPPHTRGGRGRRRFRTDSSELEDRASSPSLGGGSRPATPTLSDTSLFSPRGTEDSFFYFMSHMVQSYVQEEEVRAKHQSVLLQLREKAIKEKTKAELEWLKLKERDLKSKGADDQMPPLRKREKGLLKKLQQEQEEIRTLKEVQEAARQERKLMLLQQKEISEMHRSTQYYREKIQRYRQHSRASVSPDRSSRAHDAFSPAPSLDRTRGVDENLSSLSMNGQSDMDRDSSVAPSEHLEDSFPSYTPVRSGEVSLASLRSTEPSLARSPVIAPPPPQREGGGSVRSVTSLSPLTATVGVESLRKTPSRDSERSLAHREQRLSKHRQVAAEGVAATQHTQKQQQDLADQLVNQVMGRYEHHKKSPRKSAVESVTPSHTSRQSETSESVEEQLSGLPPSAQTSAPVTPAVSSAYQSVTGTPASLSIPEVVTEGGVASASQIRTEASSEAISRVPSEYLQDTFASLDDSTLVSGEPGPLGSGHREVMTSTPALSVVAQDQEYSLSEPRISESISETMTVTSDGSVIEAHIRSLEQQLQQKKKEERRLKKEEKRMENQKNRKRKAMLKQHELKLEKELAAVASRVSKMKSSAALYSESPSSTPSCTHSELSESEATSHGDKSPSHKLQIPSIRRKRVRSATEGSQKSLSESSATQSSVGDEQLSPVARESHTPYTSFSESVESKVSDDDMSSECSEAEGSARSRERSEEFLTSPPPVHVSDVLSARDHTPQAASHTPQAVSHTPSLDDHTPRAASHTPSRDDHTPQAVSRTPSRDDHTPQAVSEDVLSPEEELEEELEADETLTESRLLPPPEEEGVASPKVPDSTDTLMNGYHDNVQDYSMKFEPESITVDTREREEMQYESPSTEVLVQSEQVAAILRDTPSPEDIQAVPPPDLVEVTDSEHSMTQNAAEQGRERSDSDRSDTFTSSATPSQGGESEDQDRFREGQLVLIANKIEGVVRFVGPTHFARGIWVGVEIGVPKGRNDGSINGQRYFQCEPKYGLFVPPKKLTVLDEEEVEEIEEEVEHNEDEEEAEQEVEEEVRPGDYDLTPRGLDTERLRKSLSERSDEKLGIPRTLDEYSFRRAEGEQIQDMSLGGITEEVSAESLRSDMTSSDVPAPASTGLETQGERPDVLPQAPEVASQRSQSATPTPAPPPEFAEGASRESSMEPPVFVFPSASVPTAEPLKVAHDRNAVSEQLSEELVQDLTNEAYEAVHKIWRVKHREEQEAEEERERTEDDEKPPTEAGALPVILSPREKFTHMTLDQKADQITNQLLSLLVEAESNLACNIHTSKKLEKEEDEAMEMEQRSPERKPVSAPHSVASQSLASQNDPTSPTKRPPLHLMINTAHHVDASPPLLSPPSPYRSPPPQAAAVPSDYSPPGSPPRHLPQASAARVAAGERSPFSAHPDAQAPKKPARPSLERSVSTDSVYSLLDSIKITTAQCMVPSERENIDAIVERALEAASRIGLEKLHGTPVECPADVMNLFNGIREMSPEEEQCQAAYVELVYQLSLETIRKMCPPKQDLPVWSSHSTTRSLLAPRHFTNTEVSLEELQRRVYASLMRGQLPAQLPAVKFLNKMKRPGGREIDFVDQVLIRDLRGEEPGWVDYSRDEVKVKERVADALLQSLVDETVGVLRAIAEKRQMRRLDKQQDCY